MHVRFVCLVTYHEGAPPYDSLDRCERNSDTLSGGRGSKVYLYHERNQHQQTANSVAQIAALKDI